MSTSAPAFPPIRAVPVPYRQDLRPTLRPQANLRSRTERRPLERIAAFRPNEEIFMFASPRLQTAGKERTMTTDTIGVILMVLGLLAMLFALVWWDSWTPRSLPRDEDAVSR